MTKIAAILDWKQQSDAPPSRNEAEGLPEAVTYMLRLKERENRGA